MFDYILLADITNDTDASVRLAAGWKMSPSIKPSWQLPLSVNSCQRRALLSKRLANRKGENKREKKRKKKRERGEGGEVGGRERVEKKAWEREEGKCNSSSELTAGINTYIGI